jgi:hypothetical protein
VERALGIHLSTRHLCSNARWRCWLPYAQGKILGVTSIVVGKKPHPGTILIITTQGEVPNKTIPDRHEGSSLP